MWTYADGSALRRVLSPGVESGAWLRWSAEHTDTLVVTRLGITELRVASFPLGVVERERARQVLVTATVASFFDQALERAAMTTSVLTAFQALHLGFAAAHPEVGRVATYDPVLARVAVLHGLVVVSPGRPHRWYH
ncbi:hypothetical protein [Cellulomonas bogoriensis]|uniref:PIN domain-containing protein n=1 Tax=Cellulomonas bogoriensis 69B4 = DSM 16987 TaxID=1386082 RepID=A0A0A0BW88_9CELL|nr:hypothetical protein [Cellulomonas bogoriensis]KGM11434.1 hypothetical protein N869_03095 [Cellulomonas bogoriensis 69B4 = DSM 16987]